MKVKNIPIYTEDNYPTPLPPVMVMIETGEDEDNYEITFWHGVGAESSAMGNYTPCITIEYIDLYIIDYEELALEFWNTWLEDDEFRQNTFDLNFFKSLSKNILEKFRGKK